MLRVTEQQPVTEREHQRGCELYGNGVYYQTVKGQCRWFRLTAFLLHRGWHRNCPGYSTISQDVVESP